MPRFAHLVALYRESCRQHAGQRLFGTRQGGRWHWILYRDLPPLVDRCRSGLRRLGVGPGDRVALVASNRVEWAVVAYAAYGLGAAIVPMYLGQPPSEWEFIIADSGSKVVASSTEAHDKLAGLPAKIPTLRHVVGLDLPDDDPRSYGALTAGPVDAPVVEPRPEDVAGLIYTSGTSGMPKGVVLTHLNITANVDAVLDIFELDREVTLSFLPWTHSFGQTADLHTMVAAGTSIAINDDIARLVDNLGEVAPTLLCTVPRIFSRLYQNVEGTVAEKPRVLQALFRSGIRTAVTRQKGGDVSVFQGMGLALADRLIFAQVRRKLGGRLRFVVCGSAALGREVGEFIDALGIRVYEGYGLTEASPIVAANCERAHRMGSVGRPVPGVRVVIAGSPGGDGRQGEILVYGDNVMRGYHDRPDETREALLPDGGLRTGDLGYLDDDGFLFITGRIKEQYKLENGKYVVPSAAEETLKLSRYIAQVMLYGANKPYNVALVLPDLGNLGQWAAHHRVELGDIPNNPRVRALIEQELAERGSGLRSFERPKAFLLVTQDFTTENGFLTPSLKLKRGRVLEAYGAELEALYR
jgi:long-chain acyl-CoA synthetase